MENNMQKVLDIIQAVFDTIRKYLLILLGRGDEVEEEVEE